MRGAFILLLVAVAFGIIGNACMRHAKRLPDGAIADSIGVTFLFIAAIVALAAVLKGFS